MAEKDTTDTSKTGETIQSGSSPAQKFRVTHGAVSGKRVGKEGKMVDHDFYQGAIVTDAQLDGSAAMYISLGAIEPIG